MTHPACRDGSRRPFSRQLHKVVIAKICTIPITGTCNCRDSCQLLGFPSARTTLIRRSRRCAALNADEEVHVMEVALMIPCYIDVFYPQVGIATLELLERLGIDVAYPKEQTCCGQPMANSGCYEEARATEEHCARVFGAFEYVVTRQAAARITFEINFRLVRIHRRKT